MLFDRLGRDWAAYQDRLGRMRAIVIDDEEFIRDLFVDLLTDEGFEVDVAHTAETGWKLISQRPYDLLVTDKNLPGRSGVELIADVRAAAIDLPAVVITGYASRASISEALRHSAADYITKPFEDLDHIVRRLKSVADHRIAERFYTQLINDLQEAMVEAADADVVQSLAQELFTFKKALAQRISALIVDPRETNPVSDLGDAPGRRLTFEHVLTIEAARPLIRAENGPLTMVVSVELPRAAEFIAEVHAADPLVEVLAITCSANMARSLESLAVGATDFVDCGVEDDVVLLARLRRLVEAARRERLNTYLVAALYRRVKEHGHPIAEALFASLTPKQRRYLDVAADPVAEAPAEIEVDISDLFAPERDDEPAAHAAAVGSRAAPTAADAPSPSPLADALDAGDLDAARRAFSSLGSASLAGLAPGALEHVARLIDLGQTAAELVHELRQPLAGIKTSAQLLEAKPAATDVVRRYASAIVEHASRVEVLVERVNRYSRGDTREAARQRISVNNAINSAVALVRLEKKRSLAVYSDLDPQLPDVTADPIGLEQIFVNLFENARAAIGDAGGRILIRTEARNGQVEAHVEDTGPGVPKAERQRLFAPFFTTKKTGTGLGLHICRRIAERSGGTLELIESSRGAHFCLRLPAHSSQP